MNYEKGSFMWASQQPEGTKFTLKEYDMFRHVYYFRNGVVYYENGTAKSANVALMMGTWEVVDEDENWNFSDNVPVSATRFRDNIKKCRDLLKERLNKRVQGTGTILEGFIVYSAVLEEIERTFGDLE